MPPTTRAAALEQRSYRNTRKTPLPKALRPAQSGVRKVKSTVHFKNGLSALTPPTVPREFKKLFEKDKYCHHCGRSKQSKICKRKLQQEYYASLLVRGPETIYVVTPDHVPAPGRYQEIIYVVIQRPPYQSTAQSAQRASLQVDEAVNPAALDFAQGVVRAVLLYWSKNKGHIPFKTHVGIHAELLRACHQDKFGEQSFQQAASALEEYVYLVSNAKMTKRMEKARHTTNLFSILTAHSAKFPAGTFADETISEDLKELKPTKLQANVIKWYWRRHGYAEDACTEMAENPL